MANKINDEIQKLRAELTQVKLERDILRKATAFNTQDLTHLNGTRFDSLHHSKDQRGGWDDDWSI